MNLGTWDIDDLVTFAVNTHTPGVGPADADSAPTYRVYEDETGTPILTGTMALLDDANTVGQYSEQITLSAANGFEYGKSYHIRVLGTVGGVSGVVYRTLQVKASDGSDLTAIPHNDDWNVDQQNNVTTAIVALDLSTEAEIADAVWDEARAGHVSAGSFGEYVRGQLIDGAHGGVAASLQLATLDVVSADYVNMTVSDTLTVTTAEMEVQISDGAITDAKITLPAEASGRPTTALGMLRRIFEWFGNKRIRTRATGVVQLRNVADDGNLETATQSTTGAGVNAVDTQTAGS